MTGGVIFSILMCPGNYKTLVAEKLQSFSEESRITTRGCVLVGAEFSSSVTSALLSSELDSSGSPKCRAPDTVKRCGSSGRNATVDTASSIVIRALKCR
jgi:hypothetical protein